ncbi:MAG: reverse transcriptase domain-containing protein, partial [Luteococcus japonicus]
MGIREVLKVLDLGAATELELQTQYRLMPIRYDRATLLPRAKEVTDWIRPQLEQGGFGSVASVVFADKASRGMRPLAEMDLTDKVLYRALVRHISDSLPPHLVERSRYEDFQTSVAPVDTTIGYVSKTDVAAYYEYVDHALLRDELLAQTGTGPAVLLLMDVLRAVMGRSVGLPQVHSSSDILGDCYIDPIRRRLVRSGFKTSSYSDDFRIYSTTLAEAKLALEACAFEARSLGLVLNEGKTLTYTAEHYFKSLDSFDDA